MEAQEQVKNKKLFMTMILTIPRTNQRLIEAELSEKLLSSLFRRRNKTKRKRRQLQLTKTSGSKRRT